MYLVLGGEYHMLKTCKVCLETKDAVQGVWVVKHGKPVGRVCLKCASAKIKELMSTPEGKAKKSAAQKRYYMTPENRARNNEANKLNCKAKYADPVCRAKENERCRGWHARNPERSLENSKRRYAKIVATPEGRAALNAKALSLYHADPNGKAKNNMWSRAWRSRNPGKVSTWLLARRTAKTQRTPKWLTDNDKANIDASYAMAKWLSWVVGVPYHVDHIVPLRGKLVSGLHVPDNLCVRLGTDNLLKSNLWQP